MVDITAAKPFYSVLVLAFACSALVAGAAVGLRPKQEANRALDRQKNILIAAGIYTADEPVEKLFENIEPRVVDLATGEFVPEADIDPATYNQQRAPLSDEFGRKLPKESDIARLGRQEKFSVVYLVNEDDRLSQVVLPVRGKGLWSTMYAYVAVAADLSTIRGISFYQHGETPGLGGEIENPAWQAGWQGKQLYSDDGNFVLEVVKGKAAADGPGGAYQIDGISGATLTTVGVDSLVDFWFGEYGYRPFFDRLAALSQQQ